jgi:hypothetical protein
MGPVEGVDRSSLEVPLLPGLESTNPRRPQRTRLQRSRRNPCSARKATGNDYQKNLPHGAHDDPTARKLMNSFEEEQVHEIWMHIRETNNTEDSQSLVRWAVEARDMRKRPNVLNRPIFPRGFKACEGTKMYPKLNHPVASFRARCFSNL